MIFIAGGTLAFFFELLLLSKKNKCLCDKILAFWMFILGLHLFFFYFHIKEIDFEYPHLLGIFMPLPLIHGPFLFIYTGSLTRYFPKWKLKYFLHFLPVIFFYIYFFDFYTSTGKEKLEFVEKMNTDPDPLFSFFYPAILLSGFSYIFLTFLLFKRHHRNIINNLSNSSENNNLHWLRNLIIGLLVIWLVVLLGGFVLPASLQERAIYISVSLFVAFIGFFGFRQGDIFINIPDKFLNDGLIGDDKPRYIKSGLKEEQAKEIKHQLEKIIIEKKLFLDENMSLPKLAEVVNIHPNYLSQIINEKFQKNYYDFINSYRVEEFKQLVFLGKNKNKTFYAFALDCGFNSKVLFNSSFKKLTGITPSEFVKSI